MPYQRKTPMNWPKLSPQEKAAMRKANNRAMQKIRRKSLLDCSKSGIKLVTEVW